MMNIIRDDRYEMIKIIRMPRWDDVSRRDDRDEMIKIIRMQRSDVVRSDECKLPSSPA
jgi:hypothetical protein